MLSAEEQLRPIQWFNWKKASDSSFSTANRVGEKPVYHKLKGKKKENALSISGVDWSFFITCTGLADQSWPTGRLPDELGPLSSFCVPARVRLARREPRILLDVFVMNACFTRRRVELPVRTGERIRENGFKVMRNRCSNDNTQHDVLIVRWWAWGWVEASEIAPRRKEHYSWIVAFKSTSGLKRHASFNFHRTVKSTHFGTSCKLGFFVPEGLSVTKTCTAEKWRDWKL